MTTPSTTYAITIYFDDDTTNKIRTLTEELAEITGNDYMIANSVPPHLTLGMFHAEDAELEKLKELFCEFVREVKDTAGGLDFPIAFDGTDNFLDKVIFLKPDDSCRNKLCHLNEQLHQLFLPHFEPADNRNYLPGNWVPHVALAVKLSHKTFEKGMNFLKNAQGIGGAPEALRSNGGEGRNPAKPGLPSGRCAQIISIGLARCNPYTPVL